MATDGVGGNNINKTSGVGKIVNAAIDGVRAGVVKEIKNRTLEAINGMTQSGKALTAAGDAAKNIK